MARPLTKPSITGCGTMRINLPSLNTPALIWSMPISTTVANKYSTPWSATSATITTASAPVAPEIIPGRPPMHAVIKPTIKAVYKPTKGSTPATKAKATASGTSASATVRPDNKSFLIVATRLGWNSNMVYIFSNEGRGWGAYHSVEAVTAKALFKLMAENSFNL